ncbi:hypothetical protein OIO90_001991 [Microbotryomycetes sp. JL221]|nr:hypothetical protein OIO90_001991 [Microbotryomycetes sp. JL221]
MSDDQKVDTAYPNYKPEAQEQSLPGKDADMKPGAEHTKVERWTRDGKPYLVEYQGSDKLKDRAAIITGGDSGIGRSVAVFFAREGCDVTVNYLPVEEEDAQVTKKLVQEAGRKCLLIPGDLRDESVREKIIKTHLDEFKYIDVLVNNASQQVGCKDIADIDMQVVEDTFKSNIIQMIGLTKLATPHMQKGSCIINTSSVTAYKGSAAMLDYSSTKGAITAFTRSLALQLLPKGIRVNAVCPGPVYTPLQPASRPSDNMENWGVNEIPLYGRVGQPAELGAAYIFAAADSNLMTGQALHLNSGQYFVP